ncbi:hypothetical protein M747DRAFT_249768 [Aspergillus niger ATCC 13496]|uniref:Contig An04c0190, genomic contig n=3 Tax=Aspergillus niger TaxID=5061 RepID=A2QJD8_ASPNC|nr:uncharacterized protein An04g06700 [Aspergillus niger]RDH14334.1 hypothetical protein M747DRAFT_249768 [Aspergillus niger ATCC 13496]CAK44673.1 unnamed protein product [Aspergillus niger]
MRVSGSLKQRQAPERTDNIKRMEALGWKHVGSREFQGSKAQREKMSASQKRRDERGNMILALRNRNGGDCTSASMGGPEKDAKMVGGREGKGRKKKKGRRRDKRVEEAEEKASERDGQEMGWGRAQSG